MKGLGCDIHDPKISAARSGRNWESGAPPRSGMTTERDNLDSEVHHPGCGSPGRVGHPETRHTRRPHWGFYASDIAAPPLQVLLIVTCGAGETVVTDGNKTSSDGQNGTASRSRAGQLFGQLTDGSGLLDLETEGDDLLAAPEFLG